MKKDLAGSAILLGIAALYYAASTQIQASTLEDQIGPRALPAMVALLLVFVALAIGFRAMVSVRAPAPPRGDEAEGEAPWPRAFGMLLIGALYIPVASVAGYWPALLLLLIAVPVYEGMKPSWRVAAVALGGATFFWLLFRFVLGVQQPEGLLF